MEIISGKEVAGHITAELKNKVEVLKNGNKRLPKLVIIRVGEKPDDLSYQRGAMKRMDMIGIVHEEVHFEENISKEEFYGKFDEINNDESVDGILVLRPLPKHLDENRLIHTINPTKDIDGISPSSLGKIMIGDKKSFAPCTAAGVIEMLKFAGVKISGKRVTIIGRSNVVDVKNTAKNAEILVASCGKAKLINSEYVAENAVVIDVGINFDENGKLCGDVDINDIEAVAAACTPVPGGVGAVTTSMLAKQLLLAYEAKEV